MAGCVLGWWDINLPYARAISRLARSIFALPVCFNWGCHQTILIGRPLLNLGRKSEFGPARMSLPTMPCTKSLRENLAVGPLVLAQFIFVISVAHPIAPVSNGSRNGSKAKSMKIETHGDTLRVSEFEELDAAHASDFRELTRKAMTDGHRNVEVDLSKTTFIDSCGLGALVSLHKTASSRKGRVRLLHPQPQVQQLLDLTRM